MLDIIGKRFLGYIGGLGVGFVACKYLDGVDASKYLEFTTIMFGVYAAGQTITDTTAFFKGLRSLIKP